MKCASIPTAMLGWIALSFLVLCEFTKSLELWAQGEPAPTPVVPSSFEWGLLVTILSSQNVRFVLKDPGDLVWEWDICNV